MPSRTPSHESSTARRFATGIVACGLLLAAACSSDSEPTTSPAAADAGGASDAADASDAGSAGGSGPDLAESTAGAEVATARVCDLIAPFVDDIVAAFGTDLPLAEGSPDGRLESGCTIDLRETEPGIDRAAAIIDVARLPAVIADVATAAESNDIGGSRSEASSVGGDAQLLTDPADEMAIVVFSSGGRVWSVKATWAMGEPPEGHDLERAVPEVARVVRAGLEATG